jgi:hypothetical protein
MEGQVQKMNDRRMEEHICQRIYILSYGLGTVQWQIHLQTPGIAV